MNANQLLSNVMAFSRSPLGQALWDTAKFGAPRIAAAVRQQTEVTPADVTASTESFATAADAPLDVPETPPQEPDAVEPAPAIDPPPETQV